MTGGTVNPDMDTDSKWGPGPAIAALKLIKHFKIVHEGHHGRLLLSLCASSAFFVWAEVFYRGEESVVYFCQMEGTHIHTRTHNPS